MRSPVPVNQQDGKLRGLFLTVIAVVSVVAWQTGPGRLVLYPFAILATWFHEMEHGLAALLTGACFERLVIAPSGQATR